MSNNSLYSHFNAPKSKIHSNPDIDCPNRVSNLQDSDAKYLVFMKNCKRQDHLNVAFNAANPTEYRIQNP